MPRVKVCINSHLVYSFSFLFSMLKWDSVDYDNGILYIRRTLLCPKAEIVISVMRRDTAWASASRISDIIPIRRWKRCQTASLLERKR